MARFRIENSVVDTDNATFTADCGTRKGGYGHITTWVHRSRRGRWYKVIDHSWAEDGRQLDYAEWISPEEAARLLLTAKEEIPDYPEIKEAADKVSE